MRHKKWAVVVRWSQKDLIQQMSSYPVPTLQTAKAFLLIIYFNFKLFVVLKLSNYIYSCFWIILCIKKSLFLVGDEDYLQSWMVCQKFRWLRILCNVLVFLSYIFLKVEAIFCWSQFSGLGASICICSMYLYVLKKSPSYHLWWIISLSLRFSTSGQNLRNLVVLYWTEFWIEIFLESWNQFSNLKLTPWCLLLPLRSLLYGCCCSSLRL